MTCSSLREVEQQISIKEMNVKDDNLATQMRKGIVEFCFLYLLSLNRLYPSEIIAALANAGMSLKEATAYTILNRLKKDEKIDFEWKESPKGPPRKYFFITEGGIQALMSATREWSMIESTIKNILKS